MQSTANLEKALGQPGISPPQGKKVVRCEYCMNILCTDTAGKCKSCGAGY